MTEMVYGSMPGRVVEPVLPRWWRSIDRWSLTAVFALFGIGILLGLAASVPLAQRNGLDAFYYVKRQAFFGGIGLIVMLGISMMPPAMVRRLGVLGFLAAFAGATFLATAFFAAFLRFVLGSASRRIASNSKARSGVTYSKRSPRVRLALVSPSVT